MARKSLQIIPLGGVGEIGKNMYCLRYGNDIIVIDSGLKFPEEEMLGIDIVIPDMTYLFENKNNVRAVFLTHGHEDHIGGLPYLLRKLEIPVYGTKLTIGLAENKLREQGLSTKLMQIVSVGQTVKAGSFAVEFIRVNHSIPDGAALAITTPLGVILHTGDFKFDQTPVDGRVTDFHRLAAYGQRGVLALLCDSTNAIRPGYTKSEREVGKTFEDIFSRSTNRIIMATFASNIHRIQQAFDTAYKFGRKVTVIGRSMQNNVQIASELGYLKIPKGIYIEPSEVKDYPPEKLLILSTGSQGEPLAGLTLMANDEHSQITIERKDTVILSSTPVPGNEKLVNRVVDNLSRLGATVVEQGSTDVHVSGHASAEELKLMLNLTRPRYAIPFHGEYRHMAAFARLAVQTGVPEENVFLLENGQILEFTTQGARTAGRVTAGSVMVDGLGIGDVGNVVLRDRRQLSEDGVLVVVVTIEKASRTILAGPDIITRGFVYVRESEHLLEEASDLVRTSLEECLDKGITDWSTLKSSARSTLYSFLYERTKRRPMILPIIMEI